MEKILFKFDKRKQLERIEKKKQLKERLNRKRAVVSL